jgi:hypothetical protein
MLNSTWQPINLLVLQDLQQLGDLQRVAAASNSSSGLTWQQYERHAEQQLAKLEAELPMATAEAAHLQARWTQHCCQPSFGFQIDRVPHPQACAEARQPVSVHACKSRLLHFICP